jgi:membrane associated rhomboid family serine protease
MKSIPWATCALTLAIIAVTVGFAFEFRPLSENTDQFTLFVNQHGLSAVPSRVLAFYSVPYFLKAAGGYLTAPFIHHSWLHMVLSAVPLAYFGTSVEKAVGWKGLLIAFFVGAIGGEIGSSAMLLSLSNGDSNTGTIGASPAIFAVIAVFIVAYIKEWRKYWSGLGLAALILTLEATSIIDSISYQSLASSVNHASHVSGFVLGLALSFLLIRRPHDKRTASVI